MMRILTFTATLAAASALAGAAMAADVVTYQQQVYTVPSAGVVTTAPAPSTVTTTRTVVTRTAPPAIITETAPQTVVTTPQAVVTGPQTVVTREYVVPQANTYTVPQTNYTRVVARPPNCGVFHYWDGNACVDARDHSTLGVKY